MNSSSIFRFIWTVLCLTVIVIGYGKTTIRLDVYILCGLCMFVPLYMNIHNNFRHALIVGGVAAMVGAYTNEDGFIVLGAVYALGAPFGLWMQSSGVLQNCGKATGLWLKSLFKK